MRKVVASEYVTIDGVMEGPDKWMGGIHFKLWNDEMSQYAKDLLFGSDALLLGRVTYQGFAEAWPGRTDEAGFADRINTMPKYVVSTTLNEAKWGNSRLIKDNVAEEVSKLKQEPGQDILIYGSADLVHSLMQDGLIDEFHLWVDPIVGGGGKRLFREGIGAQHLNLIETKTFDTGVVVLVYQPAKETGGN